MIAFFPTLFIILIDNVTNAEGWQINMTLTIRPSTGTGVMLALVSGDTVPFALSLLGSNSEKSQVTLFPI